MVFLLLLRSLVFFSVLVPTFIMEKSQSYGQAHAQEDVIPKVDGSGDSELEPYVPGTEEEKKLVRKIDLYILPCMWIMYLLSYMDRTK